MSLDDKRLNENEATFPRQNEDSIDIENTPIKTYHPFVNYNDHPTKRKKIELVT